MAMSLLASIARAAEGSAWDPSRLWRSSTCSVDTFARRDVAFLVARAARPMRRRTWGRRQMKQRIAVVLSMGLLCGVPAFAQEKPGTTRPQDLATRNAWWREARFGMFIHFGAYAVPARGEWVQSNERLSAEKYLPYVESFRPVGLRRAGLGAPRQGGGHEVRGPHRQAPRRLLSLRFRPHRLQDLHAFRRARPRPRVPRRLPGRGASRGPLLLPHRLAPPRLPERGQPPHARRRGLREDAPAVGPLPRVHARPGGGARDALRPAGPALARLLVRRVPGREVGRQQARFDGPQAPARHPHQQPSRHEQRRRREPRAASGPGGTSRLRSRVFPTGGSSTPAAFPCPGRPASPSTTTGATTPATRSGSPPNWWSTPSSRP